jgi:hypothetical protein
MRGLSLGSILLVVLAQTARGAGSVPLVDPTLAHRAAVSGDWIVWAEFGTAYNTASIYAIDVNKPNAADRITIANKTALADTWAPWSLQFAVDGNSVFWVDDSAPSGPDSQVFQVDLSAETLTPKIIGPTVSGLGQRAGYPSASGSRVVWQAWSIDNQPRMGLVISDPWTSDPATVSKLDAFPRTSDPYQDAWPAPSLSGKWAVWKDDRPGYKGGLWARDVTDLAAPPIEIKTSDPLFDVRPPVIDGDMVAWCQRDNTATGLGVNQVVTYNLVTGVTTIVVPDTHSPLHRSNVSISGNVLVWEDWSSNYAGGTQWDWQLDPLANLDIGAWDLLNNVPITIPGASGPANQIKPWIDGDRVVWYETLYDSGTGKVGAPELKWAEIAIAPTNILGDVNLDGSVDARDINPFVQRLVTGVWQFEADTNEDGSVNFLDISRFVALLTGRASGGTVVPEPASALLILAGAAAVWRRGVNGVRSADIQKI